MSEPSFIEYLPLFGESQEVLGKKSEKKKDHAADYGMVPFLDFM